MVSPLAGPLHWTVNSMLWSTVVLGDRDVLDAGATAREGDDDDVKVVVLSQRRRVEDDEVVAVLTMMPRQKSPPPREARPPSAPLVSASLLVPPPPTVPPQAGLAPLATAVGVESDWAASPRRAGRT